MPHPWNTADALDDSRVQVEHIDLVPPKYANVLNFRSIKTRDYYFAMRDRHQQLGAVTSSKAETDKLNKHCEENTIMVDQDGVETPADYGTERMVAHAIEDHRLAANLQRIKVHILNAVQQKSIQAIRDRRGLLVDAPTGIGKTYAFLIPAIEIALRERPLLTNISTTPSPTILILANTNSLVEQLFNRCEVLLGLIDMEDIIPIRDIKIEKLVASYQFTKDQCDIAFCTMGKLKASIEDKTILLDNLKMMILDESDKMIDIACFGNDIDWVLDQLQEDVLRNLQSCFFSASHNRNEDGSIALTSRQSRMLGENPWSLIHCPRLPGYITQRVIRIGGQRVNDIHSNPWIVKMNIICKLLDDDLKEMGSTKEGPWKHTIAIFCETVSRVIQVTMALRQMGYNFKPVCSSVLKQQQAITLNDLEFCNIHGVVCTNIMSRGIDVSSVKQTIIMEMSTDFPSYMHRIGRVGRDGCGGRATVLIDEHHLFGGPMSNIIEQLCSFMLECEETLPNWLVEWLKLRQSL